MTWANKIYDTMRPGESVILNLDGGYKRNGTHWVGLYVGKHTPIVYYRDSFGFPPTRDITKAIRNSKTKRGLLYGDTIYQDKKEVNCGLHATQFIKNIQLAGKDKKEMDYFNKVA
jgi:hypothetical protein